MAGTRALMDEAGVTLATIKALRLLPEDEPLSMRKLAARLQCDNSYVTSVVDALEERGLARREGHPTDRRVKVIVLTEAGRTLARRAHDIASRPPASFAALSDNDMGTLCRLLRKLDTGEVRPPL
jgi:DNA-binding MarR family transcriptional regulator